MSPAELEHYLHEHIPISKAIGMSVVSAKTDTAVLRAPLAPNINHRETVFGGSASMLAILAAWSLLHVRLREEAVACRLVIQRNTMEYTMAITGEFTARSSLDSSATWSRFIRTLERRGKARIAVTCMLECEGQLVGRLSGEFVALGMRGS